ncbi:hypothetical protein DFH08DRAFT_956606 [Mycena albidolilacea]|uniref:Uncharacterized protein n=1 Tax=Mycena albidolilacea TaxID=1033008 RepID=A0AAD7EWW9_9AGAR|nr:hypothetical protein DFH08DRAFT_956606 [Mycena albidolilacea]
MAKARSQKPLLLPGIAPHLFPANTTTKHQTSRPRHRRAFNPNRMPPPPPEMISSESDETSLQPASTPASPMSSGSVYSQLSWQAAGLGDLSLQIRDGFRRLEEILVLQGQRAQQAQRAQVIALTGIGIAGVMILFNYLRK